MAWSDSEEEDCLLVVSNYYFEDDNQDPVSFSVLPIHWENDGVMVDSKKQIFLRGMINDGLDRIYKPVTAWNFDLSGAEPHVSVFSKDNKWWKLEKPRKNFRNIIRSTLVTLHCIRVLKKNPDLSERSLWDQMSRVFGWCDIRPSQNDLVDHWTFIEEAVKKDTSLENSKFLMALLKEKPKKKDDFLDSERFIDDRDDIEGNGSKSCTDEEHEQSFAVCEICDNGGDVLSCDGSCLRSFHPLRTDQSEESACKTLGLSESEMEATPTFLCRNCKYKQHQCFSCGRLGCSDLNANAEVFLCINATCGRFYHPKCVTKLLQQDAASAAELERKIATGEKFACPIHKCNVCGKGEDPEDPELQFAVCRRCPKSYHRKCLPREIAFDGSEEEGVIPRAWTGLLPNRRILIYCLKHDIDDEFGTPARNHIRFPDFGNKVIRQSSSLSRSRDVPSSLKSRQSLGPTATGRISPKSMQDNMKSTITKEVRLDRVKVQKYPKTTLEVLKGAAPRKPSTGNKVVAMKKKSLVPDPTERSIGEQLYAAHSQQFDAVKITKLGKVANDVNSPKKPQPASTSLSSQIPQLDQASKNRILGLIEEAKLSVTMDDIPDNPDDVSTHGSSMKAFMEKTVTLGKVEAGIEAIRTALKKLDEGYNIEDTKTFCEPNVLNQLSKWKERLRVYLAPFLNGMRYTSFGRHFTKVDRLKEIVNMIHWYVNEGDTIVDFCCGANDFSLLLKEKLDQTGKKCYFKNFDIMPPENRFCFEKRDWMSVCRNELPDGSKLIMGLNPPFGCKAALANRFINKALDFRPKLVILIVPPETERLDKKRKPYDLVWEDNQKLSGKSFYLPGSVDVNDKPIEDWNNVPPLLYLWSRQDWSAKHKDIAEMHGHLGGSVEFQSPDETKATKSALEIATEPACEAAANPAQDTAAKSAQETPAKHAQETSWKPTQETVANPTPNASVNCTPDAAANPTSDIAAYSALGICDEDGDVTMEADDEPRLNDAPNDKNKEKGNINAKAIPESIRSEKCLMENQFSKKRNRMSAEAPDRHQNYKRHSSSEFYYGRQRRSLSPADSVVDVRTADRCSFRNDTSGAIEIEDSHRFLRRFASPHSQNGLAHYGSSAYEQTRLVPQSNYHVGEISSQYALGTYDPYPKSAQRWESVSIQEPDYGVSNYAREVDSLNFRSYNRETDPTYNHPLTMSTMQRHAPRLDELNHPRVGNPGSELPGGSRLGMYDTYQPRFGGGNGPMGFVRAPSYHHQSSSGWIQE
ncbi:hypothetical protein Droror1_Dr00025533 [Drosera rotundifolia]